MKPRVYVEHIKNPRTPEPYGLCGREIFPKPDKGFVERVCGACARIAQFKSKREELLEDYRKELEWRRERVREIIRALNRKYASLTFSEVKKYQDGFANALERVHDCERKIRRLDK